MGRQKVGKGESIASIARKNGFFWKTIWNHPENSALRQERDDPSLLHEDDEIFIPEKQQKEVSKGTDAEHTFKLKGEPFKLKLQLLKLGEPRSDEKYVLEINGELIEGTTDGEGKLEHFIPGSAKQGTLKLRDGKETYPVKIGYLDPIDEPTGVQQRLNNLGYSCGGEDGQIGDKTKEALKQFQADNELDVTGEPDEATKGKLTELSK